MASDINEAMKSALREKFQKDLKNTASRINFDIKRTDDFSDQIIYVVYDFIKKEEPFIMADVCTELRGCVVSDMIDGDFNKSVFGLLKYLIIDPLENYEKITNKKIIKKDKNDTDQFHYYFSLPFDIDSFSRFVFFLNCLQIYFDKGSVDLENEFEKIKLLELPDVHVPEPTEKDIVLSRIKDFTKKEEMILGILYLCLISHPLTSVKDILEKYYETYGEVVSKPVMYMALKNIYSFVRIYVCKTKDVNWKKGRGKQPIVYKFVKEVSFDDFYREYKSSLKNSLLDPCDQDESDNNIEKCLEKDMSENKELSEKDVLENKEVPEKKDLLEIEIESLEEGGADIDIPGLGIIHVSGRARISLRFKNKNIQGE